MADLGADAADVLKSCVTEHPGVRFPVLVPNLRGLEAALAAGAKEAGCAYVTLLAAASDTFAQKNTNCTVEENLERARAVMERSQQANCSVRAAISVCLGCPYEGGVAARLYEAGCEELLICDTTGVGTAAGVRRVLEEVAGLA
eukprot:s66_g37.t1